MYKHIATFSRGIQNGSKAYSLAKTFFSSPLGEQLRTNTNLNICVRKNYFNIYWNGCSVLRDSPLAKEHLYCIHHKYVVNYPPPEKNPYVDLTPRYEDDLLCDLVYNDWSFSRNILGSDSNGQICTEVEKHIKGKAEKAEKKHISQYIEQEKPCWIDLEIAFSRRSQNKNGENIVVADRIDLAVIDDTDNGKPVLKFIEFKMAGDSRLKKQRDELPSVCEKMRIYRDDFLSDQRDAVLRSYKLIAQNMLDFGITTDHTALFKKWIDEGSVDNSPYLIVLSAKDKLAVHHCEKIYEWMKENGFPSQGLYCHHIPM